MDTSNLFVEFSEHANARNRWKLKRNCKENVKIRKSLSGSFDYFWGHFGHTKKSPEHFSKTSQKNVSFMVIEFCDRNFKHCQFCKKKHGLVGNFFPV